MICPICEIQMRVHRVGMYDDRYGYPGNFPIYKCGNCGHLCSDYRPNSQQVAEIYSEYYPRKKLDPTSWHPAPSCEGFRMWLQGAKCSAYAWVPKNVSVLDIGAGSGESLAYHAARGCRATGVEPDENVRGVAKARGIDLRVGVFRSEEIAEKFDYVTLDQVIEHFADPVLAVRDIRRVMNPNGRLIMSTPNPRSLQAILFGRRWIHWHIPYHIHFFSRESMRRLSDQTGFEMIDVQNHTNSSWTAYQWIHLLTNPGPGRPSDFWQHTYSSHFTRLVVATVMILDRLKVTHVVTRLLDLLRLGDNRVYILQKKG